MTNPPPTLSLIENYLRSLEQNADEEHLARFFTPDVRQREFPNRLVDVGAERDLSQLLAGSRKGKQVIEAQRYTVLTALAVDDRVAIELEWQGTLRVPLGNTPAGGTLRARCGVFFRVRDGRIAEQHNYDCFDRF